MIIGECQGIDPQLLLDTGAVKICIAVDNVKADVVLWRKVTAQPAFPVLNSERQGRIVCACKEILQVALAKTHDPGAALEVAGRSRGHHTGVYKASRKAKGVAVATSVPHIHVENAGRAVAEPYRIRALVQVELSDELSVECSY